MNIKRRLDILERSKRVNVRTRCQCGAPTLPFDDRLFNELGREDAIDLLLAHAYTPCQKCGRLSETAERIELIYGGHIHDHANSLAE